MSGTGLQALVLGAGISGLGAARLLTARGASVVLADQRPVNAWSAEARQAAGWGARIHAGEKNLPWSAFDLCVVSPGFPVNSDWVQAAYALSAQVCSELELGWSDLNCRTLAVTGSNGKSTAVKWAEACLRLSGQRVALAGNYGRSVCDVAVDASGLDWLVLEVSSFQLETVNRFRPDIGVLLNIWPNHLDRHGSMDTYVAMKARLFQQMVDADVALVPATWQRRIAAALANEDTAPPLAGERATGPSVWQTFGTPDEADWATGEGQVYRAGQPVVDLRGTYFAASGHAGTAAAITAALIAAGQTPTTIQQSAIDFQPLPYRLQEIELGDGIRGINDSKATNLAALAHALRSVPGPVHLIAGGRAKENQWESVKEVLTERAKCVYLIGESADEMFAQWTPDVACMKCGDLATAVTRARCNAHTGETILLSPGCASFDQFKDYQERGEHFNRLVKELAGKGL